MRAICLVFLVLSTKDCWSQDDEDGPYRGKLIGKLNSYHHQVSGDVYAVDEWTLLLVNFNYDGTGDDTFFWAGDSGRPGPQGFIVPDQHSKTNVLERYYNDELRISLPEGKRVSRIKWFAVYDIGSQNTYGDVYIPDEFEPPAEQTIGPLVGTAAVSSQSVKFIDAKTFIIPEFKYDGSGEEVYFWCGVGPQPSSKGNKIPDEYGYLEPLGAYVGSDVRLELPGALTAADISWVALWDAARGGALAAALLSDRLNVPPAATDTHPYQSALPSCAQLHRSLQVSWEVFGNAVTVQLAGQISSDEYMSFGVSGSASSSRMVGADVAVAYYDARLQRPLATDYNITELSPCIQVLGQWRGVCQDSRLGYQDSNQVLSGSRENGLTIVTYRRNLKPVESIDLEWPAEGSAYMVWALGRRDAEELPAFHHAFPKKPVVLRLGASPPHNDCFHFTSGTRPAAAAWEVPELSDPALRVFTLTLGPGGGWRGAGARGAAAAAAPPLVWYVNGQIRPDLQLRRGLTYTFKVFGGNNPHSATHYHPLLLTTEPLGGLERLSEAAQRAVRVLAGVTYTRRGRLTPAAAGALCIAEHAAGADRRRDADYASFRAFNRTLRWRCEPGEGAVLSVQPNASWPDIVYYHSFTHAGMGGRIFVVDRHKRSAGKRTSASAPLAAPLSATLAALAAVVGLLCAKHF